MFCCHTEVPCVEMYTNTINDSAFWGQSFVAELTRISAHGEKKLKLRRASMAKTPQPHSQSQSQSQSQATPSQPQDSSHQAPPQQQTASTTNGHTNGATPESRPLTLQQRHEEHQQQQADAGSNVNIVESSINGTKDEEALNTIINGNGVQNGANGVNGNGVRPSTAP